MKSYCTVVEIRRDCMCRALGLFLTHKQCDVETGQMSSVETGQTSAVETGQMTDAETSVLSHQKTYVLSQPVLARTGKLIINAC